MKITIVWDPAIGRLQLMSEIPALETVAILELAKLSIARDMSTGKVLTPGVPASLGPLPVRRVDR